MKWEPKGSYFVPWIGGGSDGAKRQKTKADRIEDAGRKSRRTAVKYKRTKAREESATLPFLAGR